MKKLLVLFLFFALLTPVSALNKTSKKRVKAFKVSKLIQLDGILDEAVWNSDPVNGFIQRDPEEGKPSTEKTNVWVAYDEENIYVAARLYDSKPNLIDASLARRDSWIDSDWFFFYIDPYLDKKTGYFFGINPGGSIIDGIYFNDSWNDDSWDGIWESKTMRDDNGWCVEIKIPFNQLRFNSSEEMTWGINFQRQIKRNNERSYYVMVPKGEGGFVSHFAELEGLNGIESKQRLEIFPYLVQKAQYLAHDSDDPFYKGNQYKTSIGADIKFGIGSNINVDLTINPDFGQVEVDPAVINLSAFETYFPEKRPFFIEGDNIFGFGYGGANNNWSFNFNTPTLFYSRRVGRSPRGNVSDNDYSDYPSVTRILGAAKLTGKIDPTWSIGAVSAVTERAYATLSLDGEQWNEEVEPLTHYGVFRTQKEFNEGAQGLGMIFTSVNRNLQTDILKEQMGSQSYTFGFDGWTALDEEENYVITGTVIGSYAAGSKEYMTSLQERPYRYFQRPDATYARLDTNRTSLTGTFARFMLNKQRGNFFINSVIGFSTPGFEFNDLGFQWFADRISGHTVLGYRWYEPDDIFRYKYVNIAHFRSYNFDGDITSNGLWGNASLQFLNYYRVDLRASYNFERYSPTLTRGGPMAKNPSSFNININAYTDNRKPIVLSGYVNYFKEANESYGMQAGFDVEWKPSTQIYVSAGPEYSINYDKAQWIENIEDNLAVNTYGTRSVFGELDQKTLSANIRVNWTFTPTLSLQLFLQPLFSVGKYNDIKEFAEPRELEFNKYGENGSEISYNSEDEEYTIDPDGNGPADNFTISNPDFNFKSLRGNLILRWEVVPGSTFYFVWSHERVNNNHPGNFEFGRDFKNLWNAASDNIFLVKFSYWFDV